MKLESCNQGDNQFITDAPVYLAFYYHKKSINSGKTLYYRLLDEAIKWLSRSKYSHCEIAVLGQNASYLCYSSSGRDGGVRKKIMPLPPERWDLLPISVSAAGIDAYYRRTRGAKYDFRGAVGLILPLPQNRSRYFCSEWCFNAIFGGGEGWRFSPMQLAIITKLL